MHPPLHPQTSGYESEQFSQYTASSEEPNTDTLDTIESPNAPESDVDPQSRNPELGNVEGEKQLQPSEGLHRGVDGGSGGGGGGEEWVAVQRRKKASRGEGKVGDVLQCVGVPGSMGLDVCTVMMI